MFEQFSNIYTIVLNVVGLIICLFHYIEKPRRSWIYVTAFLLCLLLSNYYWAAYVLLMGDDPTLSSFTAYVGDNLCFIPIFLLLIHIHRKRHVRWFSPLSLLPIPLNIYQLMIYNSLVEPGDYVGYFNNYWQCFITTCIAVLSMNLIFYYFKHKKTGFQKPYIAFATVFYITFEYAMWTSSCYDWPNAWLDPYNYCSMLGFATLVLLPIAVLKTHGEKMFRNRSEQTRRIRVIFQPMYIVVVLICSVGGYFFAMWIRDKLDVSIQATDSAAYEILDVSLFVVSGILVAFSIAIIFVVNYVHKAAQTDRLREEKAVAEQSNEAKSEFLANMSHEIRTPINAVMGMNEMILRKSLKARDAMRDDQEELRETFVEISNYAGNIDNAGKNLLSIINDILDFSKIEAGKMEIYTGEYRLSSLLNDVSNMIYYRAKSKDLEFVVDVDETLPDVLNGDEGHVRQAVVNILNNAVKYTNEGGVRMRVTGEIQRGAMENETFVTLAFEVKDTGIGIRKQDLEKLFAKFERVDLEQNKAVEGTGLGLAITRNLVEMMGGEVTVESLYGSGSTFTIRIPQTVLSDEPVGNFREKFEKSMENATAYEGSFEAPEAHILIVDDTKMNLMVAEGLLRETKIRIDTTTSGADAVRLANGTTYDVIMMDQRMPKIDGSQALKMIREQRDGYNKTTPVICLTADAVMGAKERYLAEGFTDYLTKPIDSKAMEKMLIKYLPPEKVILTQK